MGASDGDERQAALHALGHLLKRLRTADDLTQEDYPRAVSCYEQALALFRELDDATYIGFMLHNLGLIAYFQGDYGRARSLYEESLSLARGLKDDNSVAMVLGNLGLAAFAESAYEQALAYQRQALADWRSVNNKPWLARGVEHVALIAAAAGEGERAARLFGAAAALREAFGTSQQANDRELNERAIAKAREAIGEPAYSNAWDEGGRMSLAEALQHALGEERQQDAVHAGPPGDTVARATSR